MAVSWEFKEPLEPVASFVVTKIAGTFPADTYDFKAIVCEPQDDLRYGAHRTSPPVYQNSVTLDGTEGVRLTVTYDASHYSGQRVFTFVRTSGSNWWTWPSCGGLLQNGSYTNCYHTNPTTVRDVTSLAVSLYMIVPSQLVGTPWGFDKELGSGVIELTGDSGSFHIKQAFEDMENQSLANTDMAMWNGYNFFAGYWGIKFINGLSGPIDFTGMTLWLSGFDGGRYVTDGRNYTTITERSNEASTKFMLPFYGGSGCFFNLYNGTFEDTTIESGNYGMGSGTGAMQILLSNSILLNCRIHATFPSINSLDEYQNTLLDVGDLLVYPNTEDYAEPFTVIGHIRLAYPNRNQWFRGLKNYYSNNSYSVDYRLSSGYDLPVREQKFLDCEFYQWDPNDHTSITDVADYPQVIYWRYLYRGYTILCFIEHTYKVTVMDQWGLALSGVTVNVYDKDENSLASDVTDSNGELEVIIKTRQIDYTGDVDGTDATVLTNLFPIYVRVSESGYLDYEETHEEFTEPKVNNIVLFTPVYQDLLQATIEEDTIYATI